MKIKAIAPALRDEEQRKEIEAAYRRCVGKNVVVDLVTTRGPGRFETRADELISEYCIFEEGKKARQEGYDAVMPDCVMDPAVEAIRDSTGLLTLGPLRVSVNIGSLVGPRFSLVARNEFVLGRLKSKVACYGFESNIASAQCLDLSYEEFQSEILLKQALLREGIRSRKNGACALILGCTTIVDLDSWLQSEIGITVIAPGKVTLKVLEALAGLNYGQFVEQQGGERESDLHSVLDDANSAGGASPISD